MSAPKCFVFPDEDDWIVFAPVSGLLMRTNAEAAERFRDLQDTGSVVQTAHGASAKGRTFIIQDDSDTFSPTRVTISCTNTCAQRCVYCCGTPAHQNRAVLDLDFCRAAVELAAAASVARSETLWAFFHGVGEPTNVWSCFADCVRIVKEVARSNGVTSCLSLCTCGQLETARAQWIADNFDEVHVSMDGPPDIQSRQRPRFDGGDALVRPLGLARAVRAAGRTPYVHVTITESSVRRMPEIVEFMARKIGRCKLNFGMMYSSTWVDPALASPPAWQDFVHGFGEALDRGTELGVQVRHPEVTPEILPRAQRDGATNHFCLTPPNIVTAFYDIPREGGASPELGAYGWYDKQRNSIQFDHAKRLRIAAELESMPCCEACACRFACMAQGRVRGRMPDDATVYAPTCGARVGALRETLRRMVPRRKCFEEVTV